MHEFLVKYRSNPDVIKKGLQFLADNQITTAFNKYFPKPMELEFIIVDMTVEELNTYVDSILLEKIDVESRFASIIFISCFFSGAAFSAAKDIGGTMTALSTEVIVRAVKTVSQNNLDTFKSIFTEGYKTNNCENYVRHAFYYLLAFYFQALIPICEAAKTADVNCTFEEFMDSHNWNELSENLSMKIAKSDTPTEYLSKIARNYWRESRDAHLKDFLRSYAKSICKTIPDDSLQEYIIDIVENCCIRGGAFRKNDILDALILCNLLESNTIITFDKGSRAHMEKHRAARKMYDASLKLIATLL